MNIKNITHRIFAIALMAMIGIGGFAQMPAEIEPIKAPFAMPELKRPTFPERSISIVKTGAKQTKVNTAAIQKAIDKMAKKGGGTVIRIIISNKQ